MASGHPHLENVTELMVQGLSWPGSHFPLMVCKPKWLWATWTSNFTNSLLSSNKGMKYKTNSSPFVKLSSLNTKFPNLLTSTVSSWWAHRQDRGLCIQGKLCSLTGFPPYLEAPIKAFCKEKDRWTMLHLALLSSQWRFSWGFGGLCEYTSVMSTLTRLRWKETLRHHNCNMIWSTTMPWCWRSRKV